MYNINLVCTRHRNCGNCNPVELYYIIEKIRPEIIFEELSYEHFDIFYQQESLVNVETSAIKMYLLNYEAEHIPVDTYPRPASYASDLDKMLDAVFNSKTIAECHTLRNLVDSQDRLVVEYGFKYINSDYINKFHEEYNTLKGKILDILNEENLFRIDRMENEMIAKREEEMLNNIYRYSREHPYQQALLFIGAGHRATIFKLIGKFQLREELKLNWVLW